MPERVLEADVDAELLRRNRLGESHAALARAFGCSKSLVQRRIARAAKVEERRLAEEHDPTPTRTASEGADHESHSSHEPGGATALPSAPGPSPVKDARRPRNSSGPFISEPSCATGPLPMGASGQELPGVRVPRSRRQKSRLRRADESG
jgi:hypothetical protein